MKFTINMLLICLVSMLLPVGGYSQKAQNETVPAIFSYDAEETVITISKSMSTSVLDSIIEQFQLQELFIHEILATSQLRPEVAANHWLIRVNNASYLQLVQKHEELEDDTSATFDIDQESRWEDRLLLTEHFIKEEINFYHFYPTATFGVNNFQKGKAFPQLNGEVLFRLDGHVDAEEVLLSGSFNAWSTSQYAMTKTKTGWEYRMSLSPGKYLYKFIVDGNWLNDPANLLQENDGYRGKNSAFFVYNKRFSFKALPSAKKVYLVAGFNDWNDDQLAMQKGEQGWFIDLYLADGTYPYRIKADKRFYLDPDNPVSFMDAAGDEHSYTSIGDTLYFDLPGYDSAQNVYLSGNFNNWSPSELPMQKKNTGWQIPYVLGPGVYEYKFVVDGNWIIDPNERLTVGSEPTQNSIRIVKPNHTFVLKGHLDAENVVLSGSFNLWDESALLMEKRTDGWYLDYYLPPGKYRYKFKIGENWILDPDNRYFEPNEFDTGNSVLWKQPN